jgi:lipoate-protein ligase B
MRKVHFTEIGLVSHADIDVMMRIMQAKRIDDEIEDTILICEHPEIVTVGPRAKNDGVLPPKGFDSTYVDRGGGLTWHGPGQLILYPIIKWDLDGESNVKAVINLLEEWVIIALERLGIEAKRDSRMQGVWVSENKICSIGLSFLRWTSRHGFTVNCKTPAGRVELVSGCGLGQDIITSLDALGYDVDVVAMKRSLIETVETISRSGISLQ